jgi:hypothetical protein
MKWTRKNYETQLLLKNARFITVNVLYNSKWIQGEGMREMIITNTPITT